MTLKDQVDREFEKLIALGGVCSGGEVVCFDTCVGPLSVELASADTIGCAFTSLALCTDKLQGASLDRLKQISDALCSRLSYLLEPIALIESDDAACVVQMRSNPPQKDEDATSYYEVSVRTGGELRLCRYAKKRGKARQVIPACVTREVFRRLASDFEAAVV